jgi:hypothetical protein
MLFGIWLVNAVMVQFADTHKNYFVILDGSDKQAILDRDFYGHVISYKKSGFFIAK